MKVKIVVHTGPTEEGDFRPGQIVDIREGTAAEWVKRGGAIPQPDLEEKKAEPPPVLEKTEEVIETPEDHHRVGLETATMRRRRNTAK